MIGNVASGGFCPIWSETVTTASTHLGMGSVYVRRAGEYVVSVMFAKDGREYFEIVSGKNEAVAKLHKLLEVKYTAPVREVYHHGTKKKGRR